jgi:hypothetical protein
MQVRTRNHRRMHEERKPEFHNSPYALAFAMAKSTPVNVLICPIIMSGKCGFFGSFKFQQEQELHSKCDSCKQQMYG